MIIHRIQNPKNNSLEWNVKNSSIACRTTWQILITNIGRLKQLYERFSPHINKNYPLNNNRRFKLSFPYRHVIFTSYFSTNPIYYPFKQSRRSLCVRSITAESLCPTTFNVHIQAGLFLAGQLRSVLQMQLRSQGRISIVGWSKNSTSELMLKF